jgi:hypothetical protein
MSDFSDFRQNGSDSNSAWLHDMENGLRPVFSVFCSALVLGHDNGLAVTTGIIGTFVTYWCQDRSFVTKRQLRSELASQLAD